MDKWLGFRHEDLKPYEVPTPCTLTDAVEKYEHVRVPTIGIIYKQDVENFKENHLYKYEVLEDGIYEGIHEGEKVLFYLIDGLVGFNKTSFSDILKRIQNPRKIAEL